MRIVAKVTAAMQAVFGTPLDSLARTTGCVRRQRKFSDRVASGGCPPEAPTDPNVRN